MNKFITLACALATFFLTNFAQAQIALKMGATGGPVGSGPTTANQVVTLIDAGTGVAYVPAVTATYSLTNQQFGPGLVEGNPAASAMNFGGSANPSPNNSPINSSTLYALMNAIGSATNAMFTASSSHPVSTGIVVTTDRSIGFHMCSDALINANSINQQPLNARVYYGNITITFNRPVSNPVLQFVGMGGTTSFSFGGINYDMGISTEFDLVGTAVTLSKLSGNAQLSVSATQITNNATFLGASSAGTANNGITRFGASGSIVATGTNITSIVLRAYLRGDGGRVNNGTVVVAPGSSNGNVINPVWAFGVTNPWAFANFSNVAGDLMLFGASVKRPVTISGNVFNDPNGGNVNNSTGGANVVPAGMFANLTDALGNVVASVAVNTDGTYSFPAIFEGTYSVRLSTTIGTQGATAPAVALPAGWSNEGEFTGTPNTGNDGLANGISAALVVNATDVTNINFGIQRNPESAVNLQASQGNPGGFNSTAIPAGAFQTNNVGATPNTQDYEGGTITNMRITAFPANANSITINGTIYTNGGTCPPAATCTPWPGAGVTVPYTNGTGPSQAISVDPVEGNVDVIIPFAAIDNFGNEDATPGSVTIPFRTVTVSGTVWNDANGNLIQNGAEAVVNGTNAGGGVLAGAVLYANLVDAGGNIIATVPVAADGTYSFPNVPQNSTGLAVQLSQNQGTVGLAKPATALPTGWVTTGENKNGQGGAADGTANGEIPLTTLAANITQQNFGIERTPTTPNQSYTILTPLTNTYLTLNGTGLPGNPGPLNATDPEDGALGTNNLFNIIVGAGMNGNKLFYNGVEITGAVSIPNYDPALLQVQYTSPGSTSLTFTVQSFDAAGKGSNFATYNINWATPLPLHKLQAAVVLNGTVVTINWLTENEVNVNNFIAERSTDNRTFTAVATVSAGGNSNGIKNYTTQDDISSVPATVIYYRVKAVDADGKIAYSNTVAVRLTGIDGIKIWPSPFTAGLNVSVYSKVNTKINLRITDVAGKVITSTQYAVVKGNNQLNIDNLERLAKGVYLLEVKDKSGTIKMVQKIIKE